MTSKCGHKNNEINGVEEESRNYGSTSESRFFALTRKCSADDASLDTSNDRVFLASNGSAKDLFIVSSIDNERLKIPDAVRERRNCDSQTNCGEQLLFREKWSSYSPSSEAHRFERFDTTYASCWQDPKVRENWKVFIAAFGLLIAGIILILTAIFVTIFPETGIQSYVFYIVGIICFIPGAYHVVFVCCAMKGRKGYDFHQLPLFN